jgi:hypothetical protein
MREDYPFFFSRQVLPSTHNKSCRALSNVATIRCYLIKHGEEKAKQHTQKMDAQPQKPQITKSSNDNG